MIKCDFVTILKLMLKMVNKSIYWPIVKMDEFLKSVSKSIYWPIVKMVNKSIYWFFNSI